MMANEIEIGLTGHSGQCDPDSAVQQGEGT